MDDMANGIAQYLKKNQTKIPLVIRMCGTQEEVGKSILSEYGLSVYDDVAIAVQKAVELAGVN
jgi:succinyl-CoA synthetase beta subunit